MKTAHEAKVKKFYSYLVALFGKVAITAKQLAKKLAITLQGALYWLTECVKQRLVERKESRFYL